MATDRKNITLFTVPLKKGEGTNRAPLHALIPEEARSWPEEDFEYYNPLSMPKTIIFVDDRVLCCTLTTELIGLFANWTRTVTPSIGEGEEPIAQQLVREYHSVMSREALERNLTSFRSGECRILVATEAVGMGLDVPDVQRVLQWKVPQFMTVSSWWQRAGRAARDPAVWGLV
jgi:superfamily II DNA/RNA helicase